MFDLALRRPLVFETVALLLDADRRGRTIVIVDGTVEPDSILAVVERMAESIAAGGRPGALVMATCRPGGGPEPGDEDRWLEASDIADDLGVELVEWFVIGGDVPTVAANVVSPRPARRVATVADVVIWAVAGSAGAGAALRRAAAAGRRPAAGAPARGSRTSCAPAATIAGRCSSGMS